MLENQKLSAVIKGMRKLLLILTLIFPLNAFGGQQEMINACESIPGISECSRPGSSSFWVFMSTPNQPHPYNDYGSMLCNGGATKFGVPKGYSITFWNANTKKQLAKFRCY